MRGWFGIPWWVYGAAALALTVVWVFVWPEQNVTAATGALRLFLLRWGHALTWLLLAVSFFMRQWLPQSGEWANWVALGGLAAYLGFLAALFLR